VHTLNEENVFEELEDNLPKLVLCPLSNKVFCHPMLASDGYTYELLELVKRIENSELFSPMTHIKITHAHYNSQLKEAILNCTFENQYQDYDKQDLIDYLTKTLDVPFHAWKQSAYQSNNVALIALSLLASLKTYNSQEISPSFALLVLLSIGFIDYGIRMVTQHQYGFFGGGYHMTKNIKSTIDQFGDILVKIGPEILRFG
jgi:hypothetical protein